MLGNHNLSVSSTETSHLCSCSIPVSDGDAVPTSSSRSLSTTSRARQASDPLAYFHALSDWEATGKTEGATVMGAGTVGSVDVWEEIRLERTNARLNIKSIANTCQRLCKISEPLCVRSSFSGRRKAGMLKGSGMAGTFANSPDDTIFFACCI